MDRWIPMFDIFLNSPCPETEASLWLHKNFNHSSSNHANGSSYPISTAASFLSLLIDPTRTADGKSAAWIQTLPNIVQARVLSFLVHDRQRFCKRGLHKLASSILLSERNNSLLDFWVKKCAQRLMDSEEEEEDELRSLPGWLKEAAPATGKSEPMFPWLPTSPEPSPSHGYRLSEEEHENENETPADSEESEEEEEEENARGPLDPELEETAEHLKSQISDAPSTSKTLQLAKDIRKLCFENSRKNSLEILNLIRPWRRPDDDATSSLLLRAFLDGDEPCDDWPSHVLCSIALPKLLSLDGGPCPRDFLTATIGFCRAHPRAAERGLVLPLLLAKKGVDAFASEAVTKIMKECLHPLHVSAICEKLLSRDGGGSSGDVCVLPVHGCMIGEEPVWTEALFGLLQGLFGLGVCLGGDSVEGIVGAVCRCAERYSKSLKFGNFVLCLVSRFGGSMSKAHVARLAEAVGGTETLVTKSILMKLSSCLQLLDD